MVVDSEDLQVVEFLIYLKFLLENWRYATEVDETVFPYNLLLIPALKSRQEGLNNQQNCSILAERPEPPLSSAASDTSLQATPILSWTIAA